MRITFIFIAAVFFNGLQAQTLSTGRFQNDLYNNTHATASAIDSGMQKKWFITRYTGITAGYTFFGRHGAGFVAIPAQVQLNRRLNNNLVAFAGISLAPTYTNFNDAFRTVEFNTTKNGRSALQPGYLSVYSAATMGLMYINNERTFSVSGRISVERSRYPLFNNNRFSASPNNSVSSYK